MAASTLRTKTASNDVRALDGPAREMVEVDHVAALLRRQHPDLEVWHPEGELARKAPASPAWIAIGGVWAATLIMMGLVVYGMTFLLG